MIEDAIYMAHENQCQIQSVKQDFDLIKDCSIATKSYVDDVAYNMGNLEKRLEKLEKFIEKIKPMLPDEIKLYLELEGDE